MRRQADRRSGHEQQRHGRARSSEAPHNPDEDREDQVGDGGVGRHGDPGEHQDSGQEERALIGLDAVPGGGGPRGPNDHEGHNGESAGKVAQPPSSPERGHFVRPDHAAGQHRERPNRRADRRRDGERAEHTRHLLHPVQLRARADQTVQQQRADEDLHHVPELLANQAAERQSVVALEELEIHDEVAEEHAWPPAQTPQVEDGDTEPRGRPDGRDRTGVAEGLAGFGRAVVRQRESEDSGDVTRARSESDTQPAHRRPIGKSLDLSAHPASSRSGDETKLPTAARHAKPVKCRTADGRFARCEASRQTG